MKKISVTLLVALVCLIGLAAATINRVDSKERNDKFRRSTRKILNRYIVVLNEIYKQ